MESEGFKDIPEIRLFLLCCRVGPDALGDELRTLLQQSLDWDRVLDLGGRHRLLPLLFTKLSGFEVPAKTRDCLERAYRANVLHNGILTDALATLSSAFERRGLRVLPFKGPTLPPLVGGDPAVRQCGDLDLLVHPRDFEAAPSLLTELGYRLTGSRDWEATWVDRHDLVCVDLHRSIVPPHVPLAFDFDRLFRRSKSVAIGGNSLRAPCAEDALIVQCIEAAKDASAGRTRLFKLRDIAALSRLPGLDRELVDTEASRLHASRMLAFGLRLTDGLLACGTPPGLAGSRLDEAALGGPVREIVQRVREGRADTAPRWSQRLRFLAAVRERRSDAWRGYFHRYVRRSAGLLVPRRRDRAVMSLPPGASFVYYGLRPFRLLREHGIRGLSRQFKRFFGG